MANLGQLRLLMANVEGWNKWREKNPHQKIDLSGADLRQVDLTGANLLRANLGGVNLRRACLKEACLQEADLRRADLRNADLRRVELLGAFIEDANLGRADLTGANLFRAFLGGTDLGGADLTEARLSHVDPIGANLAGAKLSRAKLDAVNLCEFNLAGVSLNGARLDESILASADLSGADLRGASLRETDLFHADLTKADLTGADLGSANLTWANLTGARLAGANLSGSNLGEANLSRADLTGANLSRAIFVQTIVRNARISKSNVYGVSVWDLEGVFRDQNELVVTAPGSSAITVDHIEIAQFIYLILNNKKIRQVIDTLTSKTVLILGRFALPERKAILDALRDKLREYDLLPVVFDFERPTDQDFTETIKTLAGISYFVIADVTNPKSSPLELQATVPDYQIPFVPIIQEGEPPFAMLANLKTKYNWVLDTISYDSLETLVDILKPLIIDPAMKKHAELKIAKAAEPAMISGREYRKKQGRS